LLLGLVAQIVLSEPGGAAVSAGFVAILGGLSLNLLAAIGVNPSFRAQPALLAFHLCLLVMLLTLAMSALYHVEGHVELVEGEEFDPGNVDVVSAGLWRTPAMQDVRFVQGRIEVDYDAGLLRRNTRSVVHEPGEEYAGGGTAIGDRHALEINGFRFMTSFNKGYALLLLWEPDNAGEKRLGTVNLPSYPEYEWKQENVWVSPSGQRLQLDLRLPAKARRDTSWQLTSDDHDYGVAVGLSGAAPQLLHEGDQLLIPGGRLTLYDLRLWMGYRVDAYPMLPWVFASALLAMISLGLHFRRKSRSALNHRRRSNRRRYEHVRVG